MRVSASLALALSWTLAGSFVSAAAASAPEPESGRDKTIGAVRTDAAPTIDGRFDDPVWEKAPPSDSFTQIQPAEGKAPSERTEFRIMYDDTNLYVAVRCGDSEPEGIVSRLTRRDRDVEADWVAVSIDSRNDRNSAYTFQLSAAGVQVDGQFYNDADFNIDWDAVWTGAVTRDAGGWSAEFAIPLTVLRFSSADVQSWGVQVHRNVSRKREQMLWAYDSGGKVWGVSRFGHITGLRGLQARRAVELRPYAMARIDTHTDEGGGFLGLDAGAENEGRLEVGLDAKIGLTSRLTLDLTVNPDFGQVEADQVVLNLSRFETFFPEKRPFFLEGGDLFTTPMTLFYPRRIGRRPVGLGRGQAVIEGGVPYSVTGADGSLRLWTAAKVTGEVGDGMSIGVLGAVTGAEEVEAVDEVGNTREVEIAPLRSYGVLRGRYALGGGNFVGVAATSVNRLGGSIYRASADHDAYAQALDFAWTSKNGRWRTIGQAAVSERIGGPSFEQGDGRACSAADAEMDSGCIPIARANGTRLPPGSVGYGAQVRSAYEEKSRFLRLEYLGHSPRLDLNDAGFAQNFDIHELKTVGGFMDKEPGEYLNFRGIFPFAIAAVGFDGTPRHALVGFDLEAMFKNHTFTSPEQWILLPGTWDKFETFDGARFENPAAWEGHWEVGTNKAKMISVYGNFNWYLALGEESRAASLYTGLNVQAASNVELALEPEVGVNHSVRFYDCSTDSGKACLVDGGAHHYTFADLDSRYLSLTFRGTMTIAPPLSIQGYAQWFMADGDFSDYREVDTMGARPEIRRDDLRPSATGGDADGDGVPDDDGFEVASLNVNLVLRWEMVPGSTLFMVYTRNQEAAFARPSQLDTGPTEDVILVKVVYYAQ